MKIVKEHINEIKREEKSGLSSIGVGKVTIAPLYYMIEENPDNFVDLREYLVQTIKKFELNLKIALKAYFKHIEKEMLRLNMGTMDDYKVLVDNEYGSLFPKFHNILIKKNDWPNNLHSKEYTLSGNSVFYAVRLYVEYGYNTQTIHFKLSNEGDDVDDFYAVRYK